MDKPFAITLDVGMSLADKTGAWRNARPVYVDRLPPCNHACPAGENVQAWLYHAEGGDYLAAWRALVDDNPLPAILGRVCDRPCERACLRGRLDEAVGIAAVERFLGNEAIARGWKLDPPHEESGKRVLVVGAGPAGLSAAYHLRRRGHRVSVVESSGSASGAIVGGIPDCPLPGEVLEAEVGRIAALGVELRLGQEVARVADVIDEGKFDAAFLAVGASASRTVLDGMPGPARGIGAPAVGPGMMTMHAGVFAGADGVSADCTAAVAVGQGKKAARHIDAWLRGGTYASAPKHELAAFEHLNPWYYDDAPEAVRPALAAARRGANASALMAELDSTHARLEARRCLSCGNCFECDNCFGVCPDNAVTRRTGGQRYAFNYDYCKGCGICVSECPCGAIRMEPEPI